jgi:hypothetical protein
MNARPKGIGRSEVKFQGFSFKRRQKTWRQKKLEKMGADEVQVLNFMKRR